MPLYESPFWMPYAPAIESRWMYAPLPFPGFLTGGLYRHAVGLSAAAFPITQNGFMGAPGFPTQNLCGSVRFRRADTRYGTPSGVLYDSYFGIPVYAGGDGEVESWTTTANEYDYVFTDESLPDLIDEEGVHTPQWKPVVTFEKTVDEPEGVEHFPTGVGISAERTEYPWYDAADDGDGGKPAKKDGGETILSLPVTRSYLAGKLASWVGLPSAARRRTNVYGPWGGAVATSESTTGNQAYVTGGLWYFRCGLATDFLTEEDAGYVKGWAGTARVHVPFTHRKNAPVMRDKHHSNTTQIYNRGFTEELLMDEITEGKWLDEYGRYDPDSGAAAFTAPGWRPVPFHELASAWQQLRTPSGGGAAAVQMRTADGNSYRLTLAFKGYNAASELVVSRSDTVMITPAAAGELTMTVPEEGFFPAEIVITAAERLTGAGEFVALAAVSSSGYFAVGGLEFIGAYPFGGVGVLLSMKNRTGERWGFHAFPPEAGGDPPSGNPYYRRKIFRQSHRAVSAV